jgi:hypothetical protein
MNVKKIAAGATIATVLGFGALGGTGLAQAKPHVPGPCEMIAGGWCPGDPPGHNPIGPPGQIMQGNPVVPGLTGVPPGHWGNPWEFGLPPTWAPIVGGVRIPDQNLVWDPDFLDWGIWWMGQFIPYRP